MPSLLTCLTAAAFAFAITFASPAWSQASSRGGTQAWPSKPIRMIVNAAAGGSTDVTARSMAAKLSETLGQQVVVDNRVGAGGIIGLETAARGAPDGYTLLHASDAAILISPHLYKMNVDVNKDIESVSPTAKAALFFIVRTGLPAKNLAEFVAYARANPGKLNYGSAGHGTLQHIAAEMMMREAKFKVVHVAYKGSQQVLVDLLAGQVDFTFDLGAAIPHIKSEKVRALAVPGAARSPIFPDIPTMAEAGTNVDITWMSGVYAPAGTSREIVTRLNREIGRIMQMAETRTLLASMAAEPIPPMSAEAFAARNRRERERFGAIIRAANIKLN
jgi:tripartite-type tricarboxylate transporter receptor subunit TctC